MEHLSLYLDIEKVRFGHRLKTEIQCDNGALTMRLPSLLLQPVVDHITKVFAVALIETEAPQVNGHTEVLHRRLSEVPRLMMRESSSLPVIS